MRHITSLDPTEFSLFFASLGQPSYRLQQINQWVYKKGATSFDEMYNIPIVLRKKLEREFCFSFPKVTDTLFSQDGTKKFLFRLTDGALIEAVLIVEKGRVTLCISTQAGCRQGCAFCVTGRMGFIRSLSHHEISDQVLVALHNLKGKVITNIVLMGMGEPLDNCTEVVKAVKTLIDPGRLGFPARRITLSTVGLLPGIEMLGREGLGIKLAVSLNAPNDRIRDALMPVNRRYPLSGLIACIANYPLQPRQRITLEYCLIRGINDSSTCAMELVSLLKGVKGRVKVNLIPYNKNPLLPFHATTEECLDTFHRLLTGHGILATIRKSKGRDILAACGQLGFRDMRKGA